MILFLLVFIAIPSVLFVALSAALLAVFTKFAVSTEQKRSAKSRKLSESQLREQAIARVFWTYIGLFGAFILFLVARYFLT